jgi:hypothetical protein
MDARFPVLWQRLWRSLTIYGSIAIIVSVSLFLVVRVLKLGVAEAFRHITPLGLVVGVVGIVAFAAIMALIFSLFMRAMSVRVTDEFIEGRNYWCMRKKFPLKEIVGLSRFSSNGIDAVVVSSKRHGAIYISVHTENLDDLVELLATYLPIEQ